MPLQLGAPGLRPRAVIGVGVFPLALSSSDLGPFGMALPPDSSPQGRARNRAANAEVQRKFAPAQAHLAATTKALGAQREPPFIHDAMVLLPDRFLQLSIAALDYPRSDVPASLRFIGALPRRAAEPFAEPPFWHEVLRAQRLVVVTQGTVANHDFSQLIEPTLRALADSDALVVATLCRPGRIEHVPANARVAEFIPFEALLPHADVLVSNGGFGAVQQALSVGVPLVLAGTSEDKTEVAARVAWVGAGIDLKTQTPDEASIRRAVDAAMGSSEYRVRALGLARQYAAHDAFGEIDKTIAELLARVA